MRVIKYGLQYPDYRQEELGVITLENAVNAFKTFPWAIHLQKYREIENAGEEPAPPNICFTDGAYCLWILADAESRYDIRVSVPIKLFLIHFKKTLSFASVPEADVYTFLNAYFEGVFETIKNYK